MVEANANTAARMARMGMPLITPSQGLTALASTLSQLHQGTCLSQLAALPLDATALLAHGNLPAMTLPLLADLTAPQQLSCTEQSAMESATTTQQRHSHSIQQVLGTVSSAVSNILGFSVPPTTPLMAAGLDSLASVEVTNALQVGLGMQLPPTLVSLIGHTPAFLASESACTCLRSISISGNICSHFWQSQWSRPCVTLGQLSMITTHLLRYGNHPSKHGTELSAQIVC